MNRDDNPALQVDPLAPAALALALAMVKKLSHDLNNAQLSSQSLLELTMLDHPELTPLLEPIRTHLRLSGKVMEAGLRALPTRANVRPRLLGSWRVLISKEAADAQVALNCPELLVIPVGLAEDEWVQCLDNLVRNALEAHELGRRVQHDYAQPPSVSVEQASQAMWRVVDNGPGCSDLKRAVEGVARPGGGHLGLGLAVVAGHLSRIGGTLTMASRAGSGVVATLQWPLT